MPTKETLNKAREDRRQGKAPSTQAGEFVQEEIHHIREGKHGAQSVKQAIAIGLSKARRAGVDLPPPAKGEASSETIEHAKRDRAKGRRGGGTVSAKRSRAVIGALKRESKSAASMAALSTQARAAARRRSADERSAAARKAVRTKGPAKRSAAARKAAQTRARRAS